MKRAKGIKGKLDKLVGAYVRERMSGGRCMASGYGDMRCSPQKQWCHIRSRRYLSTRWELCNALCMCAAHHRYFTNNPTDFTHMIEERYPEKLSELNMKWMRVSKVRETDMKDLYSKLKEELNA